MTDDLITGHSDEHASQGDVGVQLVGGVLSQPEQGSKIRPGAGVGLDVDAGQGTPFWTLVVVIRCIADLVEVPVTAVADRDVVEEPLLGVVNPSGVVELIFESDVRAERLHISAYG